MILPTKGVTPQRALLTVGGEIVAALTEPKTVSRLWTEISSQRADSEELTISFDWFVLALDLAKILGAVELRTDGFVVRTSP